jgi:hypothetical protein
MAYSRTRDLPQITEPVCAHLRSKAMIVEGVTDPAQLDLRNHNHSACWCNLTQRPVGPDDNSVDVFGCTASRTCFSATR